jgi:hypothetical protein
MKYTKMLKLSLIFLSLANAVTKRREKFILFNRVAIIILLYSSIVGYDSIAITSIGRGISIYYGLFRLQLLIGLICIRKFISTRFPIDQGVTPCTPLDNGCANAGLLFQEISGLTKRLSNKFNKGLMFNRSSNLGNKKIRYYHTSSSAVKIDPNFVTGFIDAEGCFELGFKKNQTRKFGFQVQPCFSIGLHLKDKVILEKIQSFFDGIGKIYKHGDQSYRFMVYSLRDLEKIISHFEKYPLITQKWSDYQLFKQALDIIKNKKHLELEGLKELVGLKASMNRGLSEAFIAAFPDVKPVRRPIILNQKIKDPQ